MCKWIFLLLSCVTAIPLSLNEEFESSFNDINSNQSNDHLGSAINIHISEFDGERKVIIDSDDHVNHLLNTTMNKNNIPISIVTFNKYQNIMNKSLFNLQFKIDKITSKIDTLELRLNKKLLMNEHDINDDNNNKNKNISINQVENIVEKFTNDSSLRAKRKSENNNLKKYKKPHILSLYANFLPESFDNDRGNLLRRSKRTKRDIHEKINEWLIASPQLQQQFLRKWLDSKYHQNNNNEKDVNYFYHLPSKTSSLTSASQYKKNFNIENDNMHESTSESSSSSSSFDMEFDHFYDSIADDTDESSELLTPVDDHLMPTTTESIWDILWT